MSHYIVAIDSYRGDTTCREQSTWQSIDNVEDVRVLYAVVTVEGSKAEIIDDGYRSREEAAAAWPEALGG